MCFTVHPKHPTAKIAKKDIVCYKVVRYDLRPATFIHGLGKDTPYKFGKLNDKITLRVDTEKYFWFQPRSEINAGYHSYSCVGQLKRDVGRYYSSWPLAIIIVQCVIPKGEVYFFNPIEHQYVSTNIIIKEIIK